MPILNSITMCSVRLQPRATVPAHSKWRTNAFAVETADKMANAAFCQITLDSC